MRRLSRARYHRAVRHLKRAVTRMRPEKMAEALISNSSRDLWYEVKRMKGRSRKSACIIDGVNGDKDIADLFCDKYNTLYNSVPFDNYDMLRIRSTIDHRLQNTRCSGYVITPTDVRMALKGYALITLLMEQKGYNYVFLSIIFTLFSSHGFTPDSLILGTMIPIPKDKKKSFCSSSNYRAISLSSILNKILDWIISLKVLV